ncbi:hypothetical protein GCM10027088_03620 [Nocardia goodfellowii]
MRGTPGQRGAPARGLWPCCRYAGSDVQIRLTTPTSRTGPSAQLGHADGAGIATHYYIDPNGYGKRLVVDNTDALEDLKPTKVGAKLDSEALAV